MTAHQSPKRATAATVNGLQRDDRLGRQINFTANASSQLTQAFDYNLHDASQLLLATPYRRLGQITRLGDSDCLLSKSTGWDRVLFLSC
jgi:hypothetical protein